MTDSTGEGRPDPLRDLLLRHRGATSEAQAEPSEPEPDDSPSGRFNAWFRTSLSERRTRRTRKGTNDGDQAKPNDR